MKFSNSEKRLIFITFLVIVFYIYWLRFLDPLITSIDKIRLENTLIKKTISQTNIFKEDNKTENDSINKIIIPSKDVQLSNILKFLDEEIINHSFKILSASQTTAHDAIIFDIRFEGRYPDVKEFIRDISESKFILAISEILLEQNNDKIFAAIKIAAPYK